MATYDVKRRLARQSDDLSSMAASGPDTRKKQKKMQPSLDAGKFSSVQDDFPQLLCR